MSVIPSGFISDRPGGLLAPPYLSDGAPGVDFAGALNRARHDADESTVREAATQLVSSAFLQPVFAQLRERTMAEGPFRPGAAERRFGPLLDRHLADHVAGATRFSIIDAIVKRLTSPVPGQGAPREESIHA